MVMWTRWTIAVGLAVAMLPGAARTALAAPHGYQLNLWFENDLLVRKGDRYVRFQYRFVLRSEEFSDQPESHRFGSVAVTIVF